MFQLSSLTKITSSLAVAGMLVCVSSANAAPIVNNSSFEAGNGNSPSDWSAFNSQRLPENGGAPNPNTPDGTFWGHLNASTLGNQDNAATLHQQIDSSVGQGTYTVTFDVGEVTTVPPVKFYVELWETDVFNNAGASLIGEVFFDSDPSGNTPYAGIGNGAVIADLTAVIESSASSSNSLFLAFSVDNTGNPNAGNAQVLIDDVRIDFVPIPEPASLALLSMGGLLIAGRRRI